MFNDVLFYMPGMISSDIETRLCNEYSKSVNHFVLLSICLLIHLFI